MDTVFLGTTVKISLTAQGTPDVSMEDCDFDVYIWASRQNSELSPMPSDKVLHITKDECKPQDERTYVCAVDTEEIGTGYIVVRMEIMVPDADLTGSKRKEVLQTIPGIQIV